MSSKYLLSSFFFALSLSLIAQTVSDFALVPNPDDLEVDRFGNVWVNYRVNFESEEHRLARISPDGTFTDIITVPYTLGQFGINDSLIWIAGPWSNDAFVYKYDHSGHKLDSINIPYPTEIILDPDGTWYITQNALGRLLKINPDKSTQLLASGSPLDHNLALARDENGMFYTCNLANAHVIKINPQTGTKTILATLPTVNPYSVGFLSYFNGQLYVPSFRHCIYKVDTAGSSVSVFAGTELQAGDENGDISTALLNLPIATYPSRTGDSLYITDSGNGKIRLVSGLNNTTGVHAISKPVSFHILPNPVSDSVRVELEITDESINKVECISFDGVVAASMPFSNSSSQCKLSLGHLPSGVYLMKITISDGSVVSQSFVKT